jgi:hypothetical protein
MVLASTSGASYFTQVPLYHSPLMPSGTTHDVAGSTTGFVASLHRSFQQLGAVLQHSEGVTSLLFLTASMSRVRGIEGMHVVFHDSQQVDQAQLNKFDHDIDWLSHVVPDLENNVWVLGQDNERTVRYHRPLVYFNLSSLSGDILYLGGPYFEGVALADRACASLAQGLAQLLAESPYRFMVTNSRYEHVSSLLEAGYYYTHLLQPLARVLFEPSISNQGYIPELIDDGYNFMVQFKQSEDVEKHVIDAWQSASIEELRHSGKVEAVLRSVANLIEIQSIIETEAATLWEIIGDYNELLLPADRLDLLTLEQEAVDIIAQQRELRQVITHIRERLFRLGPQVLTQADPVEDMEILYSIYREYTRGGRNDGAEGLAQVISLYEVPTPRLDDATQTLRKIVSGELILLGFEAAAHDEISHGTAALRDANEMQRLQRDHDKDFVAYRSLWMNAAKDFPEYQIAIRQLQQVLRNYRAIQNSYPLPILEMTMQLHFADVQDLPTRTLLMALLFDRLYDRETMKAYIDDAEAVTQGLLAAIDTYGDSGPSIGLIVRSILSGRLNLTRSES